MIGDEMPGGTDPSPRTLGGSPVALFLYVEDVDDVFSGVVRALGASWAPRRRGSGTPL
ncbi:MAG: hypothetical protein ICV69_10510 [Thermoleophilaceae bacterium]|nr:hypothetical protein [Thermoleophilaceae bacterium]